MKLPLLQYRRIVAGAIAVFVLAVVLPATLLGTIAIRAAEWQEAYLGKQLEKTYTAELSATLRKVQAFSAALQEQLDSTAPAPGASPAEVAAWPGRDSVVGVPFLLTRSEGFLLPDARRPGLSPHEGEFLKLNADFFLDRKPTDIYRGVVIEKSEKLGIRVEPRRTVYAGDSPPYTKLRRYVARKPLPKKAAPPPAYVTESLRFSQITAGRSSGLIPRIIDDRMMLLYWKRLEGNRIAGCALDDGAVRRRIAGLVERPVNAERILAILDHNGTPLVRTPELDSRDLQSPFVWRSVSDMFPRWQMAVYLVDPSVVSSRARVTVISVGALIALLMAASAVVVTLILRSMLSEVATAQQKTTFVANVSHELKTPLTSIRLFAEMLRDGRQPDQERQHRYFDIMVSETERLTNLINNVLDFSRGRRRYDRRRLDLTELCRDIVEQHRARLQEAGFQLVFMPPAGAVTVDGDREALIQIVLNLLTNAEKYSAAADRHIEIVISTGRAGASVDIADRGPGVAPEHAERIFEEFFRADDSLTGRVRGTGLGLTIARRIARDHGGDVVYRPNVPKGSVFSIVLPVPPGDAQEENNEISHSRG